MCDPVTIGATMMVVGTVAQGYAAKQQGEYQNDVAKYNARQMENQATRTRNKGVEEENKVRERTAQLQSKQRAQLATAGVDINLGSAADIQDDTVTMGEADALRVRSNFTDQAQQMDDQALITRNEGKFAKKAGRNAFYTSLLSAGGQVAGKWYTPTSQGGFGNTPPPSN
jgi:hypothetical protein